MGRRPARKHPGCVQPIDWPIKGRYGSCTGPGKHAAARDKGPSTLALHTTNPPTPAHDWICLNCGCWWLKPAPKKPGRG